VVGSEAILSPDLRQALVTTGICTGIVFVAFLVGWLLRDRLGIPRSQSSRLWVLLPTAPIAFGALLAVDALLPSWAKGVFSALLGLLLLWAEGRWRAAIERADPLRGREGRVVVGHPDALKVEVDGEVWRARSDQGQLLLRDQRVKVQGRDQVLLVVRSI
jgi:membrane protein implicated in regulation of membrane protease activity